LIGPEIRINSPANHQVFFTGVNIPIFAHVANPGMIKQVEFYSDNTDLGPGFSLGESLRPPGTIKPIFGGYPIARLGAEYCFFWTNVPAGLHALKAVSTGVQGLMSWTSAPVNITVLTSTNLTNGPNVASIMAVDPIAIAATNSWVWKGLTNVVPAWTNWPPPVFNSFTNWGPKDALFLVRLQGTSTNDITVNYAISGTASNGVDYATLPGSVTIPALEPYALVPVVPIDNGPVGLPKTVILRLTFDTNTPPTYAVGSPPAAEAIIIYRRIDPLPWLLADRSFHLGGFGPDGAWFCVQSSSDLQNWTSLATNQVVEGAIDFADPGAPNNSSGFYRALPLNTPPAQ
jgi:hypothetical protein